MRSWLCLTASSRATTENESMNIIAYSTSTHTQWVIVEGKEIIEKAVTAGLNPFFMSRREISHVIRLELPESFFRHKWEHVFFYGAGCANTEKNKAIESSVIAQFKTHATVESDILGAARGMLQSDKGLVSILSTGANSCLYDGTRISKSIRSCGYIMGDEGSDAYLGKKLVGDVLKGIAPQEIITLFYSKFHTDPDRVMDSIYTRTQPNRTLADYSVFLAEHLDKDYCRSMVYDGFMSFFERNISFYDYKKNKLSVVGTSCTTYRSIFELAAANFGVTINKIELSPIYGLVEFHSL